MGTFQLLLSVLSVLLCLAWGWEPGTEYEYKFVGRSVAGIQKLKQQNAVIELQSRVIVQSIDDYTLVVKLADSHVKRNGNYQKSPYSIGKKGHLQEIEGVEDSITDSDALETPFSVYHTKGSISGIKIAADEPLWVVNYKKSIASQLQLDVTGASKEGKGSVFNVYEDSVTGDCNTNIAISRLPAVQVLNSFASKLDSFGNVCKGKAVYQIVKTKDFNNCKTNPAWHTTTSTVYTCDFDKANCGDFIKRTSVYKYIVCGDSLSKLTIVHVGGFSDMLAQPFAVKTDELVNSVTVSWSLEKKQNINFRLILPSYPKAHQSLSYVFDDLNQLNKDGSVAQPNLFDSYVKNPYSSVSTLQKNIVAALQSLAADITERSDAEKDKLDRLAVITNVLPMFSLDELRTLWQEIKDRDCAIVTFFVDCIVQAGSNPSVILIKELIETEQIIGHKANFALSALGYYVKTPTRELLHELVILLKSDAVKSSKTLFQIGINTVADLLNAVCGSRLSAAKRFPVARMGDFCDRKNPIVAYEFLPLVARELESSTTAFDRIVALSAIGSLGVEEVIPVLLPVIRGNGKFDDTAERVRAILSLQRVVFTAPDKVQPILASLATNFGERNEVRMAAIGLLLTSNAPLSLWQKISSSSWFEPSKQVASFTYTLITSLAKAPASTPLIAEIAKKANVVAPLVKPCVFGLPYSFHDIQSSSLAEGIAVMMHTIWMRDTDQSWPVYLSNSYFYQLGPLNREPFTISMWNFNMMDLWQNLFSKFYGGVSVKYDAMWTELKGAKKGDVISGIWEQLKAMAKPGDKRAGLLHINLLGSINRFVNLESLEEEIPKFMAETMKNHENKKPLEVNMIKYRMLGEYNVRFATDLGLPMRYTFTLPILSSIFGTVNTDGKHGMTSELAAELSWKVTGEVRVEIPFNGNFIATGVDVLVESHAPRVMTFNYNKGQLDVGWIPDKKVLDLFHFEVKPYTVTRTLTDSINPAIDEPMVHLVSITDKPIKREWSLGHFIGVNVKLMEESELPHGDKYTWDQWVTKWDINSISNLGFVPLELNRRKYVIRYDPSGTKAKTINTSYFYQYAAKSAKSNLIYETGSSKSRYPSEAEIVSYSPIAADFRPLTMTLFKDIENGNARVMVASLTSTHADGTVDKFVSNYGQAMNIRYTKDVIDWQAKYSTIKPGGGEKSNFAICYHAVRDWNHPPTFGFSKDVLQMVEVDNIGFGPECERKVTFTAKLTRDEEAAEAAKNSKAGKKCQEDMKYGFQYGSPACTKARRMDHTYNNYELTSKAENMFDDWLQWARRHTTWVNQALEPFTVEHTHAQTNTPFRASWTIKRDPVTGDCDMTFVRPHETMVAKNVRWGDKIKNFSPLTDAFSKLYFPVTASSNHILDALSLVSAGVSDTKCYVGDNAVHTFDGAHYKYTVNDCPHVLLTDCHRKSELAVLARRGKDGQKIVTVIYAMDTIEVDPVGYYVAVNGHKTVYNKMEKGSHIEIRTPGSKSIKIVIFPLVDGGVIVDIRSLQFFLKMQGSHVELSAPVHIRGRACGLCGDFNQEDKDEFKTADRCVVSSGELMAASFILEAESCYVDKDIGNRLASETETCISVDQQFPTHIPDYDVCGSAEPLASKMASYAKPNKSTCSAP